MAYKIKGDVEVANKLTTTYLLARGVDTITTPFEAVTATNVVLDLATGDRDFTIIASNTSTGDINVDIPINATGSGNRIRISITNIDSIGRNIIMNAGYIRPGGQAMATLSLPAGSARVIELYLTQNGPDQWTATSDSDYLPPSVQSTIDTVSTSATNTSFTGVDAPVIFDTTHDDTGGLVTNGTTKTIQQSGKYQITIDTSFDFDEALTGNRYIRLVKNLPSPVDQVAAAAAEITNAHSYTSSTTSGVKSNSLSVIVDLVAGDTLIAYFEAASGNDRVKTCHMAVTQLPVFSIIDPASVVVTYDQANDVLAIGNYRQETGFVSVPASVISVVFNTAFSTPPKVIHSTSTTGAIASVSRTSYISNVTTTGFDLAVVSGSGVFQPADVTWQATGNV